MIDRASAPVLLDQLQRALIRRDVKTGFYLLDSALAKTAKLDFRSPYSLSLFLSVAQWVDLGYRNLGLLDNLAADLPNVDRAHLPLMEFLKLTIAEGYRMLAREQVEECIEALDLPIASAAITNRPSTISPRPAPRRSAPKRQSWLPSPKSTKAG
jgi:hypothetical protein